MPIQKSRETIPSVPFGALIYNRQKAQKDLGTRPAQQLNILIENHLMSQVNGNDGLSTVYQPLPGVVAHLENLGYDLVILTSGNSKKQTVSVQLHQIDNGVIVPTSPEKQSVRRLDKTRLLDQLKQTVERVLQSQNTDRSRSLVDILPTIERAGWQGTDPALQPDQEHRPEEFTNIEEAAHRRFEQ